MTALRAVLQTVFYVGFAALIGHFAANPSYRHFPDDKAEIKLSFSHGAQRKGGCRPRTQEELSKLPPNMRTAQLCPRERVPMLVEVEVDGALVFRELLLPTGLSKDGPAHTYRRLPVEIGTHAVRFRLRDSEKTEGFDYDTSLDIVLVAGQSVPVDFRAERGGFVVR